MKTLHLYLLRQVFATLVMTVFVFTFVLLLANMVRDVMAVIVSGNASFGLMFQMFVLMIPYVLTYSLPMGMLTAALLVCGRLSADQELVALRASGVSLISAMTPVLMLSVVMSGVCFWINCYVGPENRVAFKNLLAKTVQNSPELMIPRSGQYVTFGQYTIYAAKVEGQKLENVTIFVNDKQGDLTELLSGPRGSMMVQTNGTNSQLLVHMEDAYSTHRTSDGWFDSGSSGSFTTPILLNDLKSEGGKINISNMTLTQLLKMLAQMDDAAHSTSANTRSEATKRADEEVKKRNLEQRMPIVVNLHRQVAFSFACIGFTLIGIPLGIRTHRRETSIGIAIALILVMVYYSFLVLGQAWETYPQRYPYLLVWLPNFLFQGIGGYLLWKANKKG